MTQIRSELAIAHIVIKVSDLDESVRFYTDIGLTPHRVTHRIASIELQGGTDLLLIKSSEWTDEDMQPSFTGQFRKTFSEQFDLMIQGHTREDLAEFRQQILNLGHFPDEIPDKTYYGHYVFSIKDPDGHNITIYTSHRQKT